MYTPIIGNIAIVWVKMQRWLLTPVRALPHERLQCLNTNPIFYMCLRISADQIGLDVT